MIRSNAETVRRLIGGAVVLSLLTALPALPAATATTSAPPASATASAAAPVLDPGLPRAGGPQRVIVTGPSAAAAVRAAGGTVGRAQPLVEGVSAVVPAAGLETVAATAGVRGVTADREGRFVNFSWDETATPTVSTFTRTTQATSAWRKGQYGRGVGVALIDTGVSPMPDLAGRLVHGPDLSGEGSLIDSYGHGTVMAGLIAGNGADSAGSSTGLVTGVAPEAHVVSVKVAGRNGVVDVSTILQAMHWVSAYRQQYNIRVLNLSWGVPSTQHPSVDPLNYAVQRLWSQGIVVVVAAGNSGNASGTITKPADDPVVLTVGAFNDRGDLDPLNDSVPAWSSRGPTAAGLVKPDLVAPGRTITSQRSYGSVVEASYPRALVAPSYIKGSGTSQAAAVASGAVALLLASRPALVPDDVKSVLKGTAAPITDLAPTVQGAGRLQLEPALDRHAPGVAQVRTATGLGSLDASRGGYRVMAECDGVLREIRGEIDVRCQAWDAARWATGDWAGEAWTGARWTGSDWNAVAWKGVNWSDATWSAVAWKGGTWTGAPWSGQLGWNGDTSATSTWTAVAWKDATWTAVAWKEATWTTGDWTTASYDEFLSAFWGEGTPPGRRLPGEVFTPAPSSRRGL